MRQFALPVVTREVRARRISPSVLPSRRAKGCLPALEVPRPCMVFARASRWLVVGGQPEAVGEHTSTAVAMVAVHLPGFTSLLGGMEAGRERGGSASSICR